MRKLPNEWWKVGSVELDDEGLPIKPNPRGFGGAAKDYGLGFASGAMGAAKSLSDAFGADNAVSKVLGDAQDGLDAGLSQEAKDSQAEQQRILNEAKGLGFGGQVAAGVRAFAEAPVQTIVQGAGSIAPYLASAFIPGGAAATAARVGMGLGMGAGSVKGSISDEVSKRELAAGKTPEQAAAAADAAQAYTGPNTDQIALGAGLGVADAAMGATPVAAKLLRQALGKEAATQVGKGAAEGLLKAGLKGAAEEMPTEFAQGTQEQVAANIAAQRAGYQAGTWDGAIAQGTMEALASAGPGAGFGAVGRSRGQQVDQTQPEAGQATPSAPADGGLSLVPQDSPVEQSTTQSAATDADLISQQQVGGLQRTYDPRAGVEPTVPLDLKQEPSGDVPYQEQTPEQKPVGYIPPGMDIAPDVKIQPEQPAKPFGQNFVMPGDAGFVEPARQRPSVAMGLNPLAGPLSASAAVAVDSGASPAVQSSVMRRAGDPVDVQPIAGAAAQIGTPRRLGESPIIDVQAREIKDQQAIAGPATNIGMTPRIGFDQPQGQTSGTQADQAFQTTAQRSEAQPPAVSPGQALALSRPIPGFTQEKAGNNPGESGSYPGEYTPDLRARNLATLKAKMSAGRMPNAQAAPVHTGQQAVDAGAAPMDAAQQGATEGQTGAGAVDGAGRPEQAGALTTVEIKDNYGRTHRVRKADLEGNADRIPTVRPNGNVVAGEEIPRGIIKTEPGKSGLNQPEQAQPLSPADSRKLQEAHKALGYGVTQPQVQSMRDRVAQEIGSGTTNNGGVAGKLTPIALKMRRAKLERLDADLALFGNAPTAQAMQQPTQQQQAQPRTKAQPLLTDDEAAMLGDFERMYQADLKGEIKSRLGLVPARQDEATSPAEKRKPSELLAVIKRAGGIKATNAADLMGGNAVEANRILPGLFTNGGMNMDLLVPFLKERGYLTQADEDSIKYNGGVNKLAEILQAELSGARAQTMDSTAGFESDAEAAMRSELDSKAFALGLPMKVTNEMSTERLNGLINRIERKLGKPVNADFATRKMSRTEAMAERQAILMAYRVERARAQYDADIQAFAEASERVQERVLDVMIDEDGNIEIIHESTVGEAYEEGRYSREDSGETGRPVATGARTGAGNPEANRTEAGAGQEGLTSYTPAEVTTRQNAAKEAEATAKRAEDAAARAEAAAKQASEIAQRSVAAADTFELGGNAEDNLSGQQGLRFSKKADVQAARTALEKIMRDGVTSPDDLRALLRVPGYSKWAKSTIAGDVAGAAALRRELQDAFPGSDWKAPKLIDQGIITIYPDWVGLTSQSLDKLTKLADKYDTPIGVRGGAATKQLVSRLDGFGFELYNGLQERSDRMPNVMFGMIRPAGGITATTPLFSQAAQAISTPASAIRLAITKAYGNLLARLEGKGLVSLTQTEEEAIVAAAQVRVDQNGGDVEAIKQAMRASVLASQRGTTTGMPENKAPDLASMDQHALAKYLDEQRAIYSRMKFGSPEAKAQKVHLNQIKLASQRMRDGSPKRQTRPSDDELSATYDTPKSVPSHVVSWLQDNNQILTSDATDAVRWVRIIDTASDNRYPAGQITLYRATTGDDIRPGDWVTTQREYAEQHLSKYLNGGSVVEIQVDGKDVLASPTGNAEEGIYAPLELSVALNEPSTPTSQGVDIRRSADGNIEGFFDPATGKSFLIADNLTAESAPATLMHEVGIHMAADGKLEPLFKRAGNMLKLMKNDPFIKRVQSRMDESGETSNEEAAAYIVTEYEKDRTNAPASVKQWVKDFMADVRAWLFSKGVIVSADKLTVADIAAVARANANRIARGDGVAADGGRKFSRGTTTGMPETQAPGPQGNAPTSPGVEVKRSADPDAQQSQYPSNPDIRRSVAGGAPLSPQPEGFSVKGATSDQLAHYRGMGMQVLGRRQIVDLYSDTLPELKAYDTLVQKMDADKNESGAEADALVSDWAKLDERSAFGLGAAKNPGMERKLAELMHDATLAQIDPDKPIQKGDDAAQHAVLAGRFNALSPKAQEVYRTARDMYANHFKKVQKAIQDRIMRSGMDETSKAKMIAKMDEDLFNKLKGVYFPLARFGKYVVVSKNEVGETVSVSRAETLAEANKMRREVVKNSAKGVTVSRVYKDAEFNASRDAVGKGFVSDLMTMLQGQGVGEDVLDSVGQLYLSSLPDLSWAKHGIHRKGTPGFSQDARRAFAQNMFHGARHLAKLRYSDQLSDKLMDMEERVKDQRDNNDFDPIKAQQVVDEMNARHETLMNPNASSLSTALTSVGFVWFLGISPASAMVNLSQTALVAYPVMASKWGFQKAGAALLSASSEVVRAGNDLGKVLKGEELAAYQKAVDDGTIDVTQAHDLAGVAQGEDERVAMAMRPVMRAASFMFHHAEKFNRQATFIAAYRLAKESGADADKAFEQAKKATYDGHFDYSSGNRPRIMQGNWQKVLFLFKQYGQNMVYTLTRQAYLSMKGMTPEQRTEARKQLGGLLAMHAMAAGALGLPLVGVLLSAASMLGGDDDEPWDAEVALKNMMADAMGPKAAEVMAHGLSRLTPWDLSGRVALNKLILPDIQEGLEGQPLWEKMVTAAAGPVAGIGQGFFKGMAEMGQGQYQRGLESMLPVALKNPVKALRFGEEGAVDKTGVVIKDEVGAAGVIGQALGFRPSDVALATEGKTAIYQADKALTERRSNLVRLYAMARMNDDGEGAQDALEQARQFNEKNPNRRITMQNLMQSVRNRQRRIDGAEQGVYLPKNRRDALEAGRFALVE